MAREIRLYFLATTLVVLLSCILPCFLAPPSAFAFVGDLTSCQHSGDETVRVCFADPPLIVNHCAGTISPNFQISRANDVPYYFAFRIFVDLGEGDVSLFDQPVDVGHGAGERTYLLTDNDAVTQAGSTNLTIPFKGDGSYYIQLTVYASGLAPLTKESVRVPLYDHPLIRSVVVGVSQYDNGGDKGSGRPVINLRHADSDARAFAAMLTQLFPGSSPVLLTSDQTKPDELPTPDNILIRLSQAVRDPGLCGDNDWFIFYFSGHGVLSSDGRNIRHYVSTKALDPSDLPSTAIWMGDLLPKIEKIGAGNKLVILDSCFSGSTHRADTFSGDNGKGIKFLRKSSQFSSKVQYVLNGKIVDAFQAVNDPDASLPTVSMSNIDRARGRALYLAAAKSDHEAEEGFEKTIRPGVIEFTPSDIESEEQQKSGHGLYTFLLVWRLESQLPESSNYKEVLGLDPQTPSNRDECNLDFMTARRLIDGDFVDKIKKTSGSELQQPDFNQTPTDLPPVKCMLIPVQRGSNVQPNQ
jgi:hypothetical protein